MIRVMVVEDEPPIAQSIKRLVEAYDDSIRVVHIAINGRRALEYLEGDPVDLVFSDIRMPVMDGLELARILSERYPQITMVIISGFQEFEFARAALRYGVNNYLLKPVSREHVAEVLDSVCLLVRRRSEKAVRSLLERGAAPPEAAGSGERCGVLLLYRGPYPLIPDDEGLPENCGPWLATAIENFVRTCLQTDQTCICITGKSQWERVVVFAAADAAAIALVADKLYRHLCADADVAVTLALWEHPVLLGEAGEIFSRLRGRIYRQIRVFHPQLISESGHDAERELDIDPQQTGLVLALQTRDPGRIHAAVSAFVDACVRQSARQTELMLFLEKTLISFFDGVLSIRQMNDLKYEVQSALSTSMRPAELTAELSQLLYEWVGSGMEQGELQTLCEEVASYLRVNYRENIRGADLARKFGLSATQLAKQFRGHFGLSVSEYVNNFRIQSAQAMMRSNRKMLIKEIAVEVGYNDQYYFSKLFKKITGIWPTEYMRPDLAE